MMLALCALGMYAEASVNIPSHFQQRAKELLADSIELTPSEHQLNVIYFVGNDVEPVADYERRLSELLLYLQQYYGKEMARNGQGNRSFGLTIRDNGNVNIILIRGEKTHRDYAYGVGHVACLEEVNRYLAAHPELRTSQHSFIVMPTHYDDKYNDLNPGGVPFYGYGKDCFALDYAHFDIKHLGQDTPEGRLLTKWYGGFAHELGHGLNLPHNDGTVSQNEAMGTPLMEAGNYTFGFSPTYMTLASCRILANSEVFVPKGCKTKFYCRTENPDVTAASLVKHGEDELRLTLETSSDVVNVNAYVQDPPFEVNRDYDAVAFVCDMTKAEVGNKIYTVTIPLKELSALKNVKGGSMALDVLIQTNDGSRFRWRVPFDLSKVPNDGKIEIGEPTFMRGY